METADRALAELKDVAEDYDSSLWSGYALASEGSVALHEGNTDVALDVLKGSWRIWRDADMPYESAKARMLLGMARQASGDETGAAREFKAARSAFQRLGATRDLERLRELTGDTSTSPTGGSRVTRTFMFTDIVTSTDLIGLIGDAAWENLLNWHDRTLREVIDDHHGEEVRHTGDGFFVAFENPRSAIEAAVAIQRRLEKHRRDHGFSPWVRIGLHQAEATREKGDYAGGGVHLAARVGDIADREEVLVSSDLLEAAGKIPYGASEPRSVTLKGVGKPVEVRTIDWR
jgi:class 3 adenylate cyclase